MGAVGIQVDPGDVAVDVAAVEPQFMALEQEVGAVVVIRVGSLLAFENEVSVLVGLGLGGFHPAAGRGGNHGSVVVVSVERDAGAGILQSVGALGHYGFREFRGKN